MSTIDGQARAGRYAEDIADFDAIAGAVSRLMERRCSWREMTSRNTAALTEAVRHAEACRRRAEGMIRIALDDDCRCEGV